MAYDRMHAHTENHIKHTTTKIDVTDHKTCKHERELDEKQDNVSTRAHNIIECSRSTILSNTKQRGKIQR